MGGSKGLGLPSYKQNAFRLLNYSSHSKPVVLINIQDFHIFESVEQKFATETTLNSVDAIFYCSVKR